jgi:hypothetical protein
MVAAQEMGRRMRMIFLLLAISSAYANSYYVTISGSGGEADYETRFAGWARELHKTFQSAGADAKAQSFIGTGATLEKIRSAFDGIAKEAKPDDTLVVVLIGHGTYDGLEYKFNIPGPDLSAVELGALMDKVAAKRQLVVNTTSCSGGAMPALRRQDRTVITATRVGTEKNATLFARYFVEALRDAAADTDKNEVISALEAFKYADQKTAKFYETQKRLATEHAILEDTGKGDGVRLPSAENGQGLLATRFPLLRLGATQAAAKDPEKLKLLAKKEEIESQIDKLKYQKAAMDVADYRKQLGALVLELARVQEVLDK